MEQEYLGTRTRAGLAAEMMSCPFTFKSSEGKSVTVSLCFREINGGVTSLFDKAAG